MHRYSIEWRSLKYTYCNTTEACETHETEKPWGLRSSQRESEQVS